MDSAIRLGACGIKVIGGHFPQPTGALGIGDTTSNEP
jgi:hypothetical protein